MNAGGVVSKTGPRAPQALWNERGAYPRGHEAGVRNL
jgi:hypothetical protein